MNSETIIKMRELEIKKEEPTSNSDSDEDSDVFKKHEIEKLFMNCDLICEEPVALNKYILQITGTLYD